MGHSNVRIKIRRRKVANLAALSKKYTVKNTSKGISPVVNHIMHYGDLSNAITCPFTQHKFVPTNPHPVPTKFGVCITGYDWVEPEKKLWVIPKGGFKQPKMLRKKYKKKYYFKGTHTIHKIVEHPSDYTTYTKALKVGDKVYTEGAFVNHTLPKMNKIQYMEKLVEHKLAKWERKHPQPCPDDDLFKVEYQKAWYDERDAAVERIRDAVVSVYDKLPLTGRFQINKDGTATYQEELIAKLEDIDGEGHRINELDPETSKLMKKAQQITNSVHAKRTNLIATNLRDHKRTKGRIILPKLAA